MRYIFIYCILVTSVLCSNTVLALQNNACTVNESLFLHTDFDKRNDVISKAYDKNAGRKVLASFSVEHHPGNHPFLLESAKKLGLSEYGDRSISEMKICELRAIPVQRRKKQIRFYTIALQRIKNIPKTFGNLSECINLLARKGVQYSYIPTVEKVAALCAIELGFLDE